MGNIQNTTAWPEALKGCQAVVHLAARAHAMKDRAADAMSEYMKINVDATQALARVAAAAGVRRFVFMSSIKVNGEATALSPFTEGDPPSPQDPYGVSKLRAEQVLRDIAAETGMEIVIVRPPLVYGPNVGGNLRRILGLIEMGIPLPLASVPNRRSLVSVWNLCDLIRVCLDDPHAAHQTFLVSDGEELSTPDLVRQLAQGLGVVPRLFSCPPGLLRLAGWLTGQAAAVERLTGSLQIDSRKVRDLLGWQPSVPVAEGLRRTAEWYRAWRSGEADAAAGGRAT